MPIIVFPTAGVPLLQVNWILLSIVSHCWLWYKSTKQTKECLYHRRISTNTVWSLEIDMLIFFLLQELRCCKSTELVLPNFRQCFLRYKCIKQTKECFHRYRISTNTVQSLKLICCDFFRLTARVTLLQMNRLVFSNITSCSLSSKSIKKTRNCFNRNRISTNTVTEFKNWYADDVRSNCRSYVLQIKWLLFSNATWFWFWFKSTKKTKNSLIVIEYQQIPYNG